MGQKCLMKGLAFWISVKKNKVDVLKTKVKQTPTTFQQALKATLVIGQLFSLLPVAGVLSNNAQDVKFVKTSWKCVYSLLSLSGQFFLVVMCVNKLFHSTVSLNGTSPIIFYGTACITTVLFIRVARRWPRLVQHIASAEELVPNYDKNLRKKCNITCGIVLALALFEHILSLLSAFASASSCYTHLSGYEGFVTHFYPWVFDFLPYSFVLGMVTQFLHFQSTFIWNFSDLFMICMSYYLTSCLQQVNKKLLKAQGKDETSSLYFIPLCLFIFFVQYLPEIFWRAARENYCRATAIVRKVDEVINGVVFISFANNLFFICLQLFNTLENGLKGNGVCSSKMKKSGPLGGHEAAAYFLFSLAYLLSRSVAVSLIASQVNTASTVPAPILYEVPSPVYCIEVQRFLDQVNGDQVALSGLQFFNITRGLLLTVAGTIVTYELVMVQFNSPQSTTSNTTLPTLLNLSVTTTTLAP